MNECGIDQHVSAKIAQNLAKNALNVERIYINSF